VSQDSLLGFFRGAAGQGVYNVEMLAVDDLLFRTILQYAGSGIVDVF